MDVVEQIYGTEEKANNFPEKWENDTLDKIGIHYRHWKKIEYVWTFLTYDMITPTHHTPSLPLATNLPYLHNSTCKPLKRPHLSSTTTHTDTFTNTHTHTHASPLNQSLYTDTLLHLHSPYYLFLPYSQ